MTTSQLLECAGRVPTPRSDGVEPSALLECAGLTALWIRNNQPRINADDPDLKKLKTPSADYSDYSDKKL
jgi:hypothetical protein